MKSSGRRYWIRVNSLGCLWLAVCFIVLQPDLSFSAPQIQSELTYIENRPTDDIFGFPGLYVLTRCDVTDPEGVSALIGPPAGATVSCNNNNFPFSQPTPMDVAGISSSVTFIHLYPISEADFPNVSGRYRYEVTNTSNQHDMLNGHPLNKLEVVPHPTNLAVSNQTQTPTVSFTDPDPTPSVSGLIRRYQVVIYDTSLNYVAILPTPKSFSTTPSLSVPPGLLCPCVSYYLRAQSIDLDTTDNNVVENMGQAFLLFTPTDVPAKTGDSNHDCWINGRDIQPFVTALLENSMAISDVCPSDFNLNGAIDVGDIPGFVHQLLAP